MLYYFKGLLPDFQETELLYELSIVDLQHQFSHVQAAENGYTLL